jgi:hypothetical protein
MFNFLFPKTSSTWSKVIFNTLLLNRMKWNSIFNLYKSFTFEKQKIFHRKHSHEGNYLYRGNVSSSLGFSFLFLFFFFSVLCFWNKDLELVRQLLCHLSYTSYPRGSPSKGMYISTKFNWKSIILLWIFGTTAY